MKPIRVASIVSSTSTLIGEADLPAEPLPESFAESTTLHLGDDRWDVEHAEPMTCPGMWRPAASWSGVTSLKRVEVATAEAPWTTGMPPRAVRRTSR